MDKKFVDIKIGDMFTINNALFIRTVYKFDTSNYPVLCVLSKNKDYRENEIYFFHDGDVVKYVNKNVFASVL